MAANKRTVTPGGQGRWTVNKAGAKRASSAHPTQAKAVKAARQDLKKSGGGELAIKNRQGTIRAQDTVKPGRDSPRRKG